MPALFCEVFVPYHRDGVLSAGPRDAFSVGKFISSFSSSDFRLFDFYFFFLSFYCLLVYSLLYQFLVLFWRPRCAISVSVVALLGGKFYVHSEFEFPRRVVSVLAVFLGALSGRPQC